MTEDDIGDNVVSIAGWGHCVTSRKFAGSITDGVTGIFHCHVPFGRTVALGSNQPLTEMGRGKLKRAETRFRLSAKRTNPFKSSVQSTTGSRGVRISGSNAGYTIPR